MSASGLQQTLAQAIAFHRAGRLEDAENAYRAVLKKDRRNADAQNLLGLVLQSNGKRDQALSCFDDAIKTAPRTPSFHYNRANLFVETGRYDDASRDYQSALKLRQIYPDAWLNYGALLYKSGDLSGAIAAFKKMTTHCPNEARGFFNLGRCLAEAKEDDAAKAELEHALKLVPDYVDALITLAKIYADTWQFQAAIPILQHALEKQPLNFLGWANLGTYLAALDNDQSAISAYDRALEINPDYADATVNRGLIHLAQGRLAEGWRGYASEVRVKAHGTAFKIPQFSSPPWSGQPLHGKSIFIWAEQGLGDQILYASMIPEIMKQARRCVLVCAERLVVLFQRSFPGTKIIPMNENWRTALGDETFDYHSSLVDLGRWCRASFGSFPNRTAYLIPDQQAVANFRATYQRQFSQAQLFIGFSWRSFAPHTGIGKAVDFETWRPFFENPACQPISLQYGPSEVIATDLQHFREIFGREPYIDPTADPSGDLDLQASQIQALDLVCGASNTAIHVAGALGTPTLAAIPGGKARLWYWFIKGHHNPWYSSVRLHRKSADGMALHKIISALCNN